MLTRIGALAAAGFMLLLGVFAHGQEWQFVFDPNGNLTVQASEAGAPPQIISQPQNQVVKPGTLATFSVVAADGRGLTYQWRFNGTNLAGGISDALLLQNVDATNEGLFSVVLVNSSGSVTSAPAALMLDSDGDGLPDSWELAYFGNLNQYPTGDFDGDGVSNLDEFLGGTNPTNSASVSFRLTLVTDGGSVEVIPNRPSYTNGEVVTLTATAVAPNIFHTWTGDVNVTNNPLTLVMNSNMTVIANLASYDISWGNQSGEWQVFTNWIPNFVPGPNDNVFINGQSFTVTINGIAECRCLTLGGGLGGPTLTGSGDLILHGDSSWLAGPMSGSGRTLVSPGVTLTVGSAGQVNLNTRTLENAGTVVWAGTGSSFFSGGVITNRPGALFDLQSTATIIGGSPARFDNAGTFRKTVNAGTTTFPPAASFNNYGAVEIQTGTLALAGGGTHTGSFDVPGGAMLNLSGGTHTLSGGSSITGAGQFSVNGGTATLAGWVNVSGTNLFAGGTANLNGNYICTNNTLAISGGIANFNGAVTVAPAVVILSSGTANFNGTGTVTPVLVNLSNGTLSGNQDVTVLNQMTWSGGTMSGAGRTILPPLVTLNLANASAVTLTGSRTLENNGTVLWAGAGNMNFGSAAVITNRTGALFETQGAGALSYGGGSDPRFDNAGTFRKSVSAGTTTIGNGVNFNNYGAIEIQTGMLLCSSSFTNNGVINLSAGATNRLANGGSATGTFNAPATALVEWTAGTFTLNSGAQLNGGGLYRISGGTVNCNTDVVAENLDLLSATLGGTGMVTVNHLLNWTGGTISGVGRTIISAGAALNLANAGAVTLTGGRTLENHGTVLWTGANISLISSAVITNGTGALFETQGAGALSHGGGTGPRLDNAGSFRKSVNTGTTTVGNGVNFNNYGAVEIQTGTLLCGGSFTNYGVINLSAGATNRLANGGLATGTFNAPATALVEWTAGTFALNSGAQLNGGGLYRITSGTVNFNTDIVTENLDLLSATLGGTGMVTVNHLMNWTGGTISGVGRTIISAGAALNLANASTVTLTGGRTLENNGTVLWTGANISLVSAVIITNRAGALFEIQGAGALSFGGGGGSRFDNAGTFRKSVNTGTNTVGNGVSFNNYGTVDIRNGTLAANGGYTSSSGALLSCALAGTAPGTGYGRLQVAGAVNLNGVLSVDLTNGFSPALSDSFTVLTAGIRNGTFAGFTYPSNQATMELSNTTTSVIVRVTAVATPPPLLLSPALSSSNVVLTWTAVSNASYRVEFNPDLSPSNWNALPGDVPGISNTASKLDALTPSNRFYRVRVLP